MNICVVDVLSNVLIPAILELRDTLKAKEVAYADVVKIGRTHLQDATPITLGQEISSWVTQIDNAVETVRRSLPGTNPLSSQTLPTEGGLCLKYLPTNTVPRKPTLNMQSVMQTLSRTFSDAHTLTPFQYNQACWSWRLVAQP